MAQRPILVVKVGTSTLLPADDAPSKTFDYVAHSITRLCEAYDIVLVTSGAIGFGVSQLALGGRPGDVHKLQALSMIGQVGLLRRWREAFAPLTIGQVLATRHDLERIKTTELFRESVRAVWEYGAMPIVNENDAVSTEEISFGDNDRLAAEVAEVLGAKILVLLTDQDGIQAGFGTPQQHRLQRVAVDDVDKHIANTKSAHGKGGATSKVQAARLALEAGARVYIAHAGREESIEQALAGAAGTQVTR